MAPASRPPRRAARRGGRRRDLQPRDRGAPGHVRDPSAAADEVLGWLEEGRPFLVATDTRRTILGFARVSAYSTRRAYAHVGEHAVYVAPHARGRKVGVTLLDALARRLRTGRLLQAHQPRLHDQPGEPEPAPRGGLRGSRHPAPPRRARRGVEGHGARRATARRSARCDYDLQPMPSAPPPSAAGAGRALTIAFESGRRMAPDALRLTPNGATLEVENLLQSPLKLTLGQLHIGLVDRGPAKAKGQAGRFPVLRRLSPPRSSRASRGSRAGCGPAPAARR